MDVSFRPEEHHRRSGKTDVAPPVVSRNGKVNDPRSVDQRSIGHRDDERPAGEGARGGDHPIEAEKGQNGEPVPDTVAPPLAGSGQRHRPPSGADRAPLRPRRGRFRSDVLSRSSSARGRHRQSADRPTAELQRRASPSACRSSSTGWWFLQPGTRTWARAPGAACAIGPGRGRTRWWRPACRADRGGGRGRGTSRARPRPRWEGCRGPCSRACSRRPR